MTGCVFCDIVAGTRAAEIVLDDDDVVAFLDVRPLFVGHTLVVPRSHHAAFPDLPARLVTPVFAAAQRLADAMPGALGSQGSFVALNDRVSQSVPHVHVHVVPRTKGDGLRGFFWPRTKYESDEQMAAVGERLRQALSRSRRDPGPASS